MKKNLYLPLLLLFSLVIISCSGDDEKDEIKLGKTTYTLYPLDEEQIEATSISDITYSSASLYHANVSNSGKITAMKVGETEITLQNAEDSKTIKVIVQPEVTLYPDPVLNFHASVSDIKKAHGEPDVEDEDVIAYENYSLHAPILMYFFSSGKLQIVVVMVKTAKSSELGTHLVERYNYLGEIDNELYFINALKYDDATLSARASLYNLNYWMVEYISITNNTRTTEERAITNEKIRKTLERMGKE